eukprot:1190444-Prorocentrum_minimum.AAC.2
MHSRCAVGCAHLDKPRERARGVSSIPIRTSTRSAELAEVSDAGAVGEVLEATYGRAGAATPLRAHLCCGGHVIQPVHHLVEGGCLVEVAGQVAATQPISEQHVRIYPRAARISEFLGIFGIFQENFSEQAVAFWRAEGAQRKGGRARADGRRAVCDQKCTRESSVLSRRPNASSLRHMLQGLKGWFRPTEGPVFAVPTTSSAIRCIGGTSDDQRRRLKGERPNKSD